MPFIKFELFKHVVEQGEALGIGGVKLTGGEPLINPEIEKILSYLAGKELRLTIETNGVACTSKLVKKMKKCKNPFISVSLDGANPKTHDWVRCVDGAFDAAIKGINNLVSGGIRPQIIMSIMKKNSAEMEKLVRLAEKIGAESVKFNMVLPTSRGENIYDSGEGLSIDELIKLGKWVENDLSPNSKIRIIYSHPFAFKSLSGIYGEKGDRGRCGIFGIIGVLGNGKYALCGIGESVPELIFGDAQKDRLKDIWNKNPVLCELREGLPSKLQGICGECIMKAQCLGSCIALNYYRYKKLLAPYWFCEEAEKAGLFPENRKILGFKKS